MFGFLKKIGGCFKRCFGEGQPEPENNFHFDNHCNRAAGRQVDDRRMLAKSTVDYEWNKDYVNPPSVSDRNVSTELTRPVTVP